ncbi:MAG: peptidoglycan-binding domain-containing protein [Minisyncoccia bacterium]
MDKRTRKQIVIALIFFSLVFSLTGFIVITHQPKPTCFDNKQNQNEEGVDCGGPCIPCDLKNNPPISIKTEPKFITALPNQIHIFFTLLNSDNEWGLKSFNYTLTLSGPNKETQTITQTDFLPPHSVRTFILPLVKTNFTPQQIKLDLDQKSFVWAKPLEGIDLESGSPFKINRLQIIFPSNTTIIQKNTYYFTKTLVLGMKDPEVFNLQKVLSEMPDIYPEGKITGVYDKATKIAVQRFQQKYGIRITGEVGPQTRQKLNELYGPKDVFNIYKFDVNKVLKLGMSGEDVKQLQLFLALDSGYNPEGKVTGVFDKTTEKAVKDFQKQYNIPQTGQVGKITASKINELIEAKYSQNKESNLIVGNFTPAEATLKVEGDLYNSTPFTFKKGEISVLLCDKNNKEVTANRVLLDKIISGQTIPFSLVWHYKVNDTWKVCATDVGINIFDLANISSSF